VSAAGVTVLVVDDEPPIRRFLRTTFGVQDYRVLEAATGGEALELLGRERLDLVVLDLGLPDFDGLDVLKAIRARSQVPVVVLSARGDERVKVAALDLGADDYVTKPFGVDELMARVRAALRHRLQQQGAQPVFRSGDLSLDMTRRLVLRGETEVKLSPKEYDILQQLVIHAGKVLTHRHLLREVWRQETADPQYLRVYVRQLRQKLEAEPERPRLILTEPGVGYRLQVLE
jgi:two-component system KDP operon response regulator KdpE